MFRKYIRFSWDIQNKPHQNIPWKSPACSVSIAQSVETAIHTFLCHVRHFDTSVSTPFHGRRHYLPLTLIHFSFSLSNQENTPSWCLLPNAICTMPGCIDRNSENWLSSRKLYTGMIWHESVWCGSGPEWCGVENLDWFLCDSGLFHGLTPRKPVMIPQARIRVWDTDATLDTERILRHPEKTRVSQEYSTVFGRRKFRRQNFRQYGQMKQQRWEEAEKRKSQSKEDQ